MTRTHSGQHGPDCYGCKLATVNFGASCTPTRKPVAVADMARESRWNRDIPAFQELRKNGVQPRQIDGCGDVAQSDAERFEIQTGVAVQGKANKERTKDALVALGHGATI